MSSLMKEKGYECPKCGKETKHQSRICHNCGAMFDERLQQFDLGSASSLEKARSSSGEKEQEEVDKAHAEVSFEDTFETLKRGVYFVCNYLGDKLEKIALEKKMLITLMCTCIGLLFNFLSLLGISLGGTLYQIGSLIFQGGIVFFVAHSYRRIKQGEFSISYSEVNADASQSVNPGENHDAAYFTKNKEFNYSEVNADASLEVDSEEDYEFIPHDEEYDKIYGEDRDKTYRLMVRFKSAFTSFMWGAIIISLIAILLTIPLFFEEYGGMFILFILPILVFLVLIAFFLVYLVFNFTLMFKMEQHTRQTARVLGRIFVVLLPKDK